ncbi:hypothetical protein HMPREF1992_01722 [Selenomonas sp. oral taxon 892 str. F0426]|nr:hypothetical protein HMPREF1992_01722 [Selenomonas sp. oral taxon 892 str. F0426]
MIYYNTSVKRFLISMDKNYEENGHKNSPHSTVDYLCCVLYFRRALETSEDIP